MFQRDKAGMRSWEVNINQVESHLLTHSGVVAAVGGGRILGPALCWVHGRMASVDLRWKREKSPPLPVHLGMEYRPTLVSMEHLLSLGESGACVTMVMPRS